MQPQDEHESQLRLLIETISKDAVVVKNPDIWASYRRGSDWDLAVRSLPDAYRLVVGVLGSPTSLLRRSYVWAIDYGWMQLDLLPRLEWRGVPLVPASRLFAGRVPPLHGDMPELPVARPAHQAMAACVYPAMAHGSIKERYASVWEEAWSRDGDELAGLGRHVFGGPLLEDLTFFELPRAQRLLRSRAVATTLRRAPLVTTWSASRFALAEGRVRLQGR